jgi:hypothetical protein
LSIPAGMNLMTYSHVFIEELRSRIIKNREHLAQTEITETRPINARMYNKEKREGRRMPILIFYFQFITIERHAIDPNYTNTS